MVTRRDANDGTRVDPARAAGGRPKIAGEAPNQALATVLDLNEILTALIAALCLVNFAHDLE
jgi:hypothetical protein